MAAATRGEGPREISTLDAVSVLESGVNAGVTYGFGYWGEIVRWGKPTGKPLDKWEEEYAQAFREGKPVVINEHNDSDLPEYGQRHQMGLKRLLRGIALYAHHAGLAPWKVIDECDGPTADLCIQYAIFGEEKYS